jgi:hypothetical protein
MAFIQFPWRLLMVPALACGVLAAILLSAVRHPTRQALLVLSAVAIQWYVTEPYRTMASVRQREPIRIDEPVRELGDNGERWAFREAAYDPVSVRVRTGPTRGRWTVAQGRGDVTPTSVTDDRLELAVRADEPLHLVINTAFVPGWRVWLDEQSVAPSVLAPSGYMEVRVPAGSHRVEAVFTNSPLRAAAEVITLISVALWLAVAGCALPIRRLSGE